MLFGTCTRNFTSGYKDYCRSHGHVERLDIQSAYLPCHQLSVRSCNIGSALVFAGIGCASANGILVKGSNYLEGLSDTKYVVFDKTGTLTKGVFEVTGVYPENGYTKDSIVRLAAYSESASSHPISLSLKNITARILTKTVLQI